MNQTSRENIRTRREENDKCQSIETITMVARHFATKRQQRMEELIAILPDNALLHHQPLSRRGARAAFPTAWAGLIVLLATMLLLYSEPVASFAPLFLQTIRRETFQMYSSTTLQAQTQDRHVVVVGGGVGGMAVAARIASEKSSFKTKVTLLEKNSEIGGRCGSFWVDPESPQTNATSLTQNEKTINHNLFRHEQGPSLLLLPSVYQDVFTDTTTSRTASDFGLDIVPCSPAYQIVFDDGDRISVGFPKDSLTPAIREEELKSRAKMDSYETDGAAKWDDYMAITAAYLDAGLPNFIEEKLDLLSLPNFLVQSLKDGAKAWPLKPHSDVLDALFDSNKLRALASFQDLYVGLEPYKNPNLLGGGVLKSTAPAVFGLLAAIELHPTNKNGGVFAPIGGFQSVTNAFETLLDDLGVEIRCDTNVQGVTNEGVWARKNGREDDSESEFIPADLTIVNADLPYAKKSLLLKDIKGGGVSDAQTTTPIPPPAMEKFDWDDKYSFSSGVISFYWSVDKSLEDLNTHNVFLSTKTRSQAEASWQVLREPEESDPQSSNKFDNDSVEDTPFNFYVHRPSKTDPSAAPSGCDTIMVLVPCRTLLRDEECAKLPRNEAMKKYQEQFSENEISRVRQAVLKRFAEVESLKGLEDHILHEEYRTPATWADRYNLAAGTPFALSHGFAQLSLTRPGPKSTGLPNVLYCGASTRPGNGVPLVLIGAKQVAEKALQALNTSTE